MSVDQKRKIFAIFVDTLLNGGLNQIIVRFLFFSFCR